MKHRHRLQNLDSKKFINEIKKFPALYDPNDPEYRNMYHKNTAWKDIATVVDVPVRDCQLRWKSLRDRFVREKRSYKQDPTNKIAWPLYYHLSFLTNHISHKTRKNESNSEVDITEDDESNAVLPSALCSTVKTDDDNSAEVEVVYNNNIECQSPEIDPSVDLGITVGDISIGPVTSLATSRLLSPALSPRSTTRKRTYDESKVISLLTKLVNKSDPDEDELFFMSAAKMMKRVPVGRKSALKMKIMELIVNAELT